MQTQWQTNAPARRFQSAQIALLLVLGSETIFFGTLLSSYLSIRLGAPARAGMSAGGLLLPAANTIVLLLSALAASLGERAIRKDHARALQTGLLVALVLGLVFVVGQVMEFTRSGLHPGDAAVAGMYFALISFHAVHVLVGVFVLALNLVLTSLGDFSARRYTPIQVGNWFWYYVTGVWLILFSVLYLV